MQHTTSSACFEEIHLISYSLTNGNRNIFWNIYLNIWWWTSKEINDQHLFRCNKHLCIIVEKYKYILGIVYMRENRWFHGWKLYVDSCLAGYGSLFKILRDCEGIATFFFSWSFFVSNTNSQDSPIFVFVGTLHRRKLLGFWP